MPLPYVLLDLGRLYQLLYNKIMLVRKYSGILVRVAYEMTGQLPFSSRLTIHLQHNYWSFSSQNIQHFWSKSYTKFRLYFNAVSLCGKSPPANRIRSECKVALVYDISNKIN